MSKRVADVLVETLEAAGVRTCYGIVGDTLNRIAHSIDRSEIDWVHMRHEEAGAFAASAEALITGRLTACAGSCGPGSLHFINGLYEANRNRAPVILIATQIVRQDIGFESIQEIDFDDVFKGCSVFCEMVVTPEQARRKAVAACQAALTRRGVAVLVVPADVANADAHNELPYAVHVPRPLLRPSDADLDKVAAILNESDAITIYAGAGCEGAHDEVVATAARLLAPMAHTSRGLVPLYTDLKNPDFGEVAKAMGLWGGFVSKAGELEESIQAWLTQPGPALLHVKVEPMQLVTPPSPFVSTAAVVGMAVYSARAVLQGKGHDVWEMVVENLP